MRLALTCLLAAACVGLTQPPKLPTLSAKKLSRTTSPTQGSGALSLIKPMALPPGGTRVQVSPITRTNVLLTWGYAFTTNNPQSNIVFKIYSIKTNQFVPPSTNWPVVGVVTNTRFTNRIDRSAKCQWFAVTASNAVTRLESTWATR